MASDLIEIHGILFNTVITCQIKKIAKKFKLAKSAVSQKLLRVLNTT